MKRFKMTEGMEAGRDLIIIRGLPGSGKSTLAALLAGGDFPVLSIDDYFTDVSGVYTFRYAENHKAYAFCEQRCEEAMKGGVARIFIDNVFSMDWEMEPYFRLAEKYAYRVHVLCTENRHGGENTHGVSRGQLEKMAAKFRVKLL